MKKVLTQEEINALLTDLGSSKKLQGTEKAAIGQHRPVQLYDFKHPERISKEQIRTLRTIHDNFARMLATYLSTTLRSMTDVTFNSIDQVTFNEYMLSLTVPDALYTLDVASLDGKAIMEISPQFLLFMVDRLLGGIGDTELESREITIIEQSVVRRVIDNFIGILNEAWTQVHPIEAKVQSFESDPQFVQVARSTEAVAIIFFEIRTRNTTYMMNLGFPYYILEPILARLSAQTMMAVTGRKVEQSMANQIGERIQSTRTSVHAVLAETTVKVSDFIDLKVDDLLQLDQRTSAPLKVHVDDKPKFLASPGRLGRKNAVKILRKITPEEELEYE